MGSGKGKSRRVQAVIPNSPVEMRERCLDFPESLMGVAEEVVLRDSDEGQVMPHDFYVGIFYDLEDGFPAVITAWGWAHTGLQYKVEKLKTKVLAANNLTALANTYILNKCSRGFHNVSDTPEFDPILLEKKLKSLDFDYQRLHRRSSPIPTEALEKVTF